MSTSYQQGTQGAGQGYPSPNFGAARSSTAWSGWLIFAATMLILVGGFTFIDGLVALFNAGYYGSHYTLLVGNLQAWGWWSLVVGLILIAAGFGIFSGSLWARIVGIVVAALNALAHLTIIAVFPFWALVVIGIDVIVIYALAVHEDVE
jgi:hypothetical protein